MPDRAIPVIDLFAGPGGLGEGFSSLRDRRGDQCFRIRLSIEKDKYAHETLRLRALFRQFHPGEAPSEYYGFLRGELTREELFSNYPKQAAASEAEAWLAELGCEKDSRVHARIGETLGTADPWILIGGPPCQAYSIAGRARNKGVKGYIAGKDHRQTLYIEYLKVIAAHWPAAFIMENVAGLTTAKLEGRSILDRILSDLQEPSTALGFRRSSRARSHRYQIYSLANHGRLFSLDPQDYVVKAEDHGVPQSRHRIILFGLRDDMVRRTPATLPFRTPVSLSTAIGGMPRLRSGVSRTEDNGASWLDVVRQARSQHWLKEVDKLGGREVQSLILETLDSLRAPNHGRGGEFVEGRGRLDYEKGWFIDPNLDGLCNHSTKAHMDSDLHRYLYAVCYATVHDRSPRLRDFPVALLPEHVNAGKAVAARNGMFADRFRVQLRRHPATTITSHIHKDGHYYIHYDPKQCRSLTVREAARVQTFPDNYFFCGPRTEQYTQVGNAVPPLLARGIAQIVLDALR